jgi:hypothetical protein
MMQTTYKLATYHPERAYDAIVFVAPSINCIKNDFAQQAATLSEFAQADKSFSSPGNASFALHGKQALIFASTGPLVRDIDDPRMYRTRSKRKLRWKFH